MKVEFPIIIEHEGSDWFASTPDLPGCFATGNGLEQIIRNARRAISLHVVSLAVVPSPSNFSDIDSDGNKVVLVDIDI
ncbi:MAG: type II toxin-antitoxin system HicB family antitoxin [Nitrosomonas sp.]|nr:type II toxin-antitoxin system HicB family antitoxin [Nitrosomonas sp.]